MNTNVAYPVLGVYLLLVLGAGLWGAFLNFTAGRRTQDKVREHFLAGRGLSTFVWFFTMLATLFSGYSVSGIVNEAYNQGWVATRWIPGGVGLYVAFGIIAPRIHGLAKRRGYFTVSQVIFDRYSSPYSSTQHVAHALHILTFACLQLPVFTYLISQFQSIGLEVRTFTGGEITAITAVLTAAGVLLLCDLLGGMRAVAFTDVLQGLVLFLGSILFLIIQKTELGGLDAAHDFWSNPNRLKLGNRFRLVQLIPPEQTIVAYFDFVFKTTVAATMFPHLTARLFAAKSAVVMRRGLSVMVFTFFIVQLSSMITGWVAISALFGKLRPGQSAFGKLLQLISGRGTGQAFLAALLLASAICAMMSTADSAMLAFSSMWVRDVYTKYVRKNAGHLEQIIFGKVMGLVALSVGVTLALYSIEKGKPDLSSFFALQSVTPIHVAPGLWLGLHWRRLRGEAVLVGLVTGLSITLGLVFSDQNVRRAAGGDLTKCGLSSAWIGFCANMGLTVLLGLAMQFYPKLFGMAPVPYALEAEDVAEEDGCQASAAAAAAAAPGPVAEGFAGLSLGGKAAAGGDAGVDGDEATGRQSAEAEEEVPPVLFVARPLDIGPRRDRILNPFLWFFMFLVLLFTVPFYREPLSRDGYVGAIGKWPFTSLLLSGFLAIAGSLMFTFLWEDYKPLGRRNDAPASDDGEKFVADKSLQLATAASAGGDAEVPPAAAAAPAKPAWRTFLARMGMN